MSRRHVLSTRTCPPRTHRPQTAPLAPLVHPPSSSCSRSKALVFNRVKHARNVDSPSSERHSRSRETPLQQQPLEAKAIHSLSHQKNSLHGTSLSSAYRPPLPLLQKLKSWCQLVRTLFVTRGPAPSARLVFSPAPLRAPSRTCSKGVCPLAFPPPRPVRGTRESVLARSQGNHSPKKRPPLYMNFDPRLGSPLPHPVHGEVGRESERGRQ